VEQVYENLFAIRLRKTTSVAGDNTSTAAELAAEVNGSSAAAEPAVKHTEDEDEDEEEEEEEEEALPIGLAKVLFDYEPQSASELALAAGAIITLFQCPEDDGADSWWLGAVGDGEDGWFPSAYVERIPNTAAGLKAAMEREEADEAVDNDGEVTAEAAATASAAAGAGKTSKRDHVIAEILKTERDYVSDLVMLISGFGVAGCEHVVGWLRLIFWLADTFCRCAGAWASCLTRQKLRASSATLSRSSK
jgi:ribosomal protein L12E/L44/L45/RPP1/RPP2